MSEYLSDKFYCLAPDQRGYGKSYVPECVEDYKMELLIQDLKGIIEHFGSPFWLKNMIGDFASAYGLAIAYPELVSGLIIMNGVHLSRFKGSFAKIRRKMRRLNISLGYVAKGRKQFWLKTILNVLRLCLGNQWI